MGAVGLMQLMPATAAELGLRGDEIRNPAKNIEAGVKYLDQLLRRYRNNLPLALAAYNAGYGAVDKAGRIPQNGETPRYVRDILRLFEQSQKEARLQ
jgi:soluble lytic murein transglycosylase-like protein